MLSISMQSTEQMLPRNIVQETLNVLLNIFGKTNDTISKKQRILECTERKFSEQPVPVSDCSTIHALTQVQCDEYPPQAGFKVLQIDFYVVK